MSKVVVLDGSDIMRSVLSEIVEYLGHEVWAYAQVGPFIENMRVQPADYVIVSATLKEDANGLEVIEQVRGLPTMQDTRYILLSANPGITPLRERLHQRQIELLSKPCSLEDLQMALQ